jgi:hypothetical protein
MIIAAYNSKGLTGPTLPHYSFVRDLHVLRFGVMYLTPVMFHKH